MSVDLFLPIREHQQHVVAVGIDHCVLELLEGLVVGPLRVVKEQ